MDKTKEEVLGLKDAYNYYVNLYEEPVEYKEFARLIKLCNEELINLIVNNAETIDLPYRLGELGVSKFERVYSKDNRKWAVDFKKTKQLGHVVYFDQKHIYRWVWRKHRAIVINKAKYRFLASRFAKREIPKALDNKKDFFRV